MKNRNKTIPTNIYIFFVLSCSVLRIVSWKNAMQSLCFQTGITSSPSPPYPYPVQVKALHVDGNYTVLFFYSFYYYRLKFRITLHRFQERFYSSLQIFVDALRGMLVLNVFNSS